MSFLQTTERIINLKNVSNINIIKNRKRIVFNLNYNIELIIEQESDKETSKLISDYIYWDSANAEKFQQNIESLKQNKYLQENFIEQFGNTGYINVNEISSVKFCKKKFRVIFNLSHPVSFNDFSGTNKVTSEFVYVNCRSTFNYEKYVNYVKKLLL